MTASNAVSSDAASGREIVATRLFDAPRRLVWRMWTDAEHVAQWWGPNGFRNTIHEMDVRPGGAWRLVMHGPDGTDYTNKFIYLEVVEPSRLVYDHVTGPLFRATVTFTDRGEKTEVTVRMEFDSAELRNRVAAEFGAVEGLHQSLGRLADKLAPMPKDGEFVITRVFDAPRELVFRSWTECNHLKHWWGPKDYVLTRCQIDLRPGGVFLYCLRPPEGADVWGKFVYREVIRPERLVFVNSFSDENGGTTRHPLSDTWPLEWDNVITFAESDRKTTLTLRAVPSGSEIEIDTFDRSRHLLAQGYGGTFDQLDAYLEKAK